MNKEKKLGEELLKQNGLQPGTVSAQERQRLHQMIAKQRARVRRMKWATIISWSLLAVCYVVEILRELDRLSGAVGEIAKDAVPLAIVLFPIAILSSVSWFLRSLSLGQRQIQAKLADIEAQLERLQQGRPTDTPGQATSPHPDA